MRALPISIAIAVAFAAVTGRSPRCSAADTAPLAAGTAPRATLATGASENGRRIRWEGACATAKHQGDSAPCFSARFLDAPLLDVLRELQSATGVGFVLLNPATARLRISCAVHAQSPAEAVEQTLRGISYVLYFERGRLVVQVMTSDGRASPKGDTEPVPVADQGGGEQPDVVAEEERLQPELDAAYVVESEESARLARALEAIGAAPDRLHPAAAMRLVGLHSPVASNVLIGATATAQPPRERLAAVRRLWQHAAALGFDDRDSVAALTDLATDGDQGVRQVALQALEDARQFVLSMPAAR